MNAELVQVGTRLVRPHIDLVLGDVVFQRADAIVSSAAPSLEPTEHGVDRAIRRAAGNVVTEQLRRVRAERFPMDVPVTECVATSAGALHARWILHVVPPKYDGRASVKALEDAYANVLHLADQLGVRALAMPAIGAGCAGFPPEVVAEVAIRATRASRSTVSRVTFVLHKSTHAALVRAFVDSA